MNQWGEAQVRWVKHILRYLRRSENNSLIYTGKHNGQLSAYVDASHLNCPDTRRSISAYIIKLGNDSIDFKCSFQTIISHSSMESELVALDCVCRRLKHMRWLIEAIGGPKQGPTIIYTDSQAVIDMTNNPIISKRSLHIEAKYFRVRQYIQQGDFKLVKVASKDQQADLLCTYKGKANFQQLVQAVKGTQPPIIDGAVMSADKQ